MPAASDWTTSVISEEVGNHFRRTVVQISGDGTMSYNSTGASGAGLPIPAIGNLGMRRNLDTMNIIGVSSDSGASRSWKVERSTTPSFSIRLYRSNTTASITSPGEINQEVPSGTVVTTGTLYVECYGW